MTFFSSRLNLFDDIIIYSQNTQKKLYIRIEYYVLDRYLYPKKKN